MWSVRWTPSSLCLVLVIRLWNYGMWFIDAVMTYSGHTSVCWSVRVERQAVVSCSVINLKLWNVDSSTAVMTYSGHTNDCWSVRWTQQFVSCLMIRLWNYGMLIHRCYYDVMVHTGGVCFSVELNAKQFASCSRDKTLKLWNVDSSMLLWRIVGIRIVVEVRVERQAVCVLFW